LKFEGSYSFEALVIGTICFKVLTTSSFSVENDSMPNTIG
jgi:hypothetical protein